MLPAQLIDLDHVDEAAHLGLDGVHAHIAIQLRQQVLDFLLRGNFFLFLGLCRLGLGGRFLGFFRYWGLVRLFFHQGRAPKIRVHATEVPLGHGADQIHLLQNDLVFSVHICSPHQI